MSHISCVQTPVNASGKNRMTVFFLPRLLLSLMSVMPDALLDLSEKSGAFVPTAIAIIVFFALLVNGSKVTGQKVVQSAAHVKRRSRLCGRRTAWAAAEL